MAVKVKVELVGAQRYIIQGILYKKGKVYEVSPDTAEILLGRFRKDDMPYFRGVHEGDKKEAKPRRRGGQKVPAEILKENEADVAEDAGVDV